jgi:hypothetical protein
MDDRYAPQPLARWYMAAAIISLLLMLFGCANFVIHLATDPATLPLDQRALFEAEPGWVSGAFGAASIIGAIGSLMLILRRRAALPLLLIAMLLIVVWFAGLFAVPQLRDLLSTNEIAVGISVLAITWTIFWFARHSRQRGWLR